MRYAAIAFGLLFALVAGTAAAQGPRITGMAYAHVSLTIKFGDGNGPSYSLEGSVFPRVALAKRCIGRLCAAGMATPFGYWYDPDHFATDPTYHQEELAHIRQWEALGPFFPLAYIATLGEPFEPYPTRNLIAISATQEHHEWFNLNQMWQPPADMQRAFPQLRITWGGQDTRPQATILTGYNEFARDIVAAARGKTVPTTPATITTITNLNPDSQYTPVFDDLNPTTRLAFNTP